VLVGAACICYHIRAVCMRCFAHCVADSEQTKRDVQILLINYLCCFVYVSETRGVVINCQFVEVLSIEKLFLCP